MAHKDQPTGTTQLQDMMPKMANMAMIVPHMQATMAKAVLRQQREMLSFLNQRCGANMELAEQLSAAEDVKDVSEVYSAFFRNAGKAYVDEAKKEAEVSSATLVEITQEMQSVANNANGSSKNEPQAA